MGCGPALNVIDPLTDPRWSQLVASHPASSVFHTKAWLKSLHDTYGCQPLAFTAASPGANLDHAIVFCKISSTLTGRRCISLPFSDHAAVLADEGDSRELIAAATHQLASEGWRNLEVRPTTPLDDTIPADAAPSYAWHLLDLTPSIEELFQNCHHSSIQRKIRRARREGLTVRDGQSPELLQQFYSLMLRTRRRHRLPPAPRKWFKTLAKEFGSNLVVRVAYSGDRPIASVLTLRHRNTIVYKNGCSIEEDHRLGGAPLLIWSTIEAAKQEGITTLDLGRSDLDNYGLIQFKDRWGARRMNLTYLSWATCAQSLSRAGHWRRIAGMVFAHLPARLGPAVGSLLYKHFA